VWRFYAMCALWLALGAVDFAVQFFGLWPLIFPVGLAGFLFCSSASHWLLLGRWLDYRPAFRLIFDREFRERMTRPD
jgi:hypothetical protein